MLPRVHLQTLGCRLNEAEIELWARQFQLRGFALVNTPEQADLLVFNTCAVTEDAACKSRRLLRQHRRDYPHAQLIASGCQVSLAASEHSEDWVVLNQDKDDLVEIVVQKLGLTAPLATPAPQTSSLLTRGRQRAFLKVQDGCRYQCSFCVVTQARGPARSQSRAAVLAAALQIQDEGIREALLTGVCLGDYGRERGDSLAGLVRTLLAETDLPRLRLGALEPWDGTSKLWELFANPRLQPHLHLPLQSGAASVLRRMTRPGSPTAYRRLVDELRAAIPDLTLTTDVLVGFPGETAAEWQATLDLVADCGFAHIHLFPFSPRPGTQAATLPNPVHPQLRRQRCAELQTLAQSLHQETCRQFLGRTLPVLVEGRRRQVDTVTYGFGHTPNFLPVWFPLMNTQNLTNQIVPITLTAIDADNTALRGQMDMVITAALGVI